MSSKSKSAKYSSDKCPDGNQRVKFRCPKKSLSSEVLGSSKSSLSSSSSTRRQLVRGTRSKNSITVSGQESFSTPLTEVDLAGLSKDKELGKTFDKLWMTVKSGMEKNCQSFAGGNTPIDTKMTEIHNRIMLNQAVLQSANRKLKSINFKSERDNFAQWREKMFANFPQEDGGTMREDMNALDLEIEKLKERKSDKSVFLKSSPGIANFHKTMESTLSMLDKIQNTNEFRDYDSSIHAIKTEFDLDYIKAPKVITASDEE